MTKQELIEMVGNEEQVNYALEIVLKNLQPGFIRTVVNLELKAIGEEIQKMKDAGFIVTNNGHDRVNWGKAMAYIAPILAGTKPLNYISNGRLVRNGESDCQ